MRRITVVVLLLLSTGALGPEPSAYVRGLVDDGVPVVVHPITATTSP